MSHVTKEQRYTICSMLNAGFSQTDIAKTIKKHKSTVSREIKRNADKRSKSYKDELAQRKYESRLVEKPKHSRFTDSIIDYIEAKLKDKFSPEQIVGKARKDGIDCVSHESIYQYIYADQKGGGNLYLNQRRKKKKRKKRLIKLDKRGQIQNRVSIKERPKIVDLKKRVGDFEIDTIIGANHKGAIVTINERRTGLVKLIKLKGKNADALTEKTIKALMPFKDIIKTITADNGKEFAYHEKISKALEIKFYFADPYSSWQRGANENLNGLVRQYLPKKTNFEFVTTKQLKQIELDLNNRPRKRLGYNTPKEEFNLLTKVAFVV